MLFRLKNLYLPHCTRHDLALSVKIIFIFSVIKKQIVAYCIERVDIFCRHHEKCKTNFLQLKKKLTNLIDGEMFCLTEDKAMRSKLLLVISNVEPIISFYEVLTGSTPKYLNAMVWPWEGGFLQWRWGLGQAPGTDELMRAHKREPSLQSSGSPPERVASCDDHVGGSWLEAHFKNRWLLLREGHRAEMQKIFLLSNLIF